MPDYPHPPLIGISGESTNSKSVAAMVAQVRAMGGIPLVLANHATRNAADDILKLDGLIVMGNNFDIDPAKYINNYPEGDPRRQIHPKTNNQSNDVDAKARAVYEEQMLKLAMERKLPTLAVCGGMQTINVILGGGLLQHIPDLIGNETHAQDKNNVAPMSPVIPVEINKESALGNVAGNTKYIYTPSYPPADGNNGSNENSFHHQAIDPQLLGKGLRISASSDPYTSVTKTTCRLPEAIEPDPNGPLKDWPMFGVQWHPEFGATRFSAKLIQASIDRMAEYADKSPRDRSQDEQTAYIETLKSTFKPVPVVPATPAKNQVPLPTQSQTATPLQISH